MRVTEEMIDTFLGPGIAEYPSIARDSVRAGTRSSLERVFASLPEPADAAQLNARITALQGTLADVRGALRAATPMIDRLREIERLVRVGDDKP